MMTGSRLKKKGTDCHRLGRDDPLDETPTSPSSASCGMRDVFHRSKTSLRYASCIQLYDYNSDLSHRAPVIWYAIDNSSEICEQHCPAPCRLFSQTEVYDPPLPYPPPGGAPWFSYLAGLVLPLDVDSASAEEASEGRRATLLPRLRRQA